MNRLRLLMILTLFVVVLALQALPAQAFPVSGWTKYYEGMEYATGYTTSPRLMRAWAARISLRNPDVHTHVTPGNGGAPYETALQTTPDFRAQFDCQVAVNCSFFNASLSPNTDIWGLALAGGAVVSAPDYAAPFNSQLNFTVNKIVSLVVSNSYPANGYDSIAGSEILLSNGTNVGWVDALNPLTGYGISQDGKYLIMVIVDGRQPGWSEGCNPAELAQWMLDFGAWNGVKMDGGGSTTMTWANMGTVNRPCYGYPRSVGLNFGIGSTLPNIVGPSAVYMSDTSRTHVAVRGNMNDVIIKTYVPGTGWVSTTNLSGPTLQDPALVSYAADHLMCIVLSPYDQHYYYKTWTSAGGWTANWSILAGGNFASGPSACRMGNNRIDIVGRDTNNNIGHIYWTTSGGWSAWETLPGPTYYKPAVISQYSGELSVYAVSPNDNHCYEKVYVTGNWTGWGDRGGNLAGGMTACVRGTNGSSVDIYSRDPSGNLMTTFWRSGSGWYAGGWLSLGGPVGNIGVTTPSDTTMTLLVRGNQDHLWSKTFNGVSWGGFVDEQPYFD